MNPNKRPISYISLCNRFWRIHKTRQFNATAIALYFHLIDVANSSEWPDSFSYPDTWLMTAVGSSLPTIRKAKKALQDAGLIFVKTGGFGAGKKTVYSFTGCDHCEYKDTPECLPGCLEKEKESDDILSPKGGEGETKTERKSERESEKISRKYFTPIYKEEIKTKKDLLQSPISNEEVFDLKNLKAPHDGVQRNLTGLLEKLTKLKASPAELKHLLTLSNYGQIGHPIWSALFEITSADGKIQAPIRFLYSRINMSMSNSKNA